MAHHKSALKRIRQSRKRRLYNRQYKKVMKEAIKAVMGTKIYEEAAEKLKAATKVLDRNISRGVIHKNFASNRKSALALYVNSLKAKTN